MLKRLFVVTTKRTVVPKVLIPFRLFNEGTGRGRSEGYRTSWNYDDNSVSPDFAGDRESRENESIRERASKFMSRPRQDIQAFKDYEGSGILHHENGDVYEGQFKNGQKHGKGVITHSDGTKWEGTFNNGRVDTGSGVHRWKFGSFVGAYVHGKVHCKRGELRTGDKYLLVGEFRNGAMYTGSGSVQLNFPNDLNSGEKIHVKSGRWIEGKYISNGTDRAARLKRERQHAQAEEKDGVNGIVEKDIKYEKVEKDEKSEKDEKVEKDAVNRKGKVYRKYSTSTLSYEGEWEGNVRSGYGKMIYKKNGNSYEGYWLNDEYHGPGKLVYGSGEASLVGTFRKGKPFDATGTYHNKYLKDVSVGTWVEGRMEGYGTVKKRNSGMIYNGTFVKGLRHGEGVLRSGKSGNPEDMYELKGEFREGLIYNAEGVCVLEGKLWRGKWMNRIFEGTKTPLPQEAPSSS